MPKKINFEEKEQKLIEYTKDTPYFTFNEQIHLAKVVYCYDGDTCHCVFKHDGDYYRFRVRMNGYDSPEMRPRKSEYPDEKDRKEIKRRAVIARDKLKDLVLNKIVILECNGEDKYGRLLGTIKLKLEDEKTVNDLMVEDGQGYIYNGGTKDQSIFTQKVKTNKSLSNKIKKIFSKNKKKIIN